MLGSRVLGCALLVAACSLSGRSDATVMTPLDLPALTQRADAVVAGRVTGARSSWTTDHTAIYTEVTIHVDRVLAGEVGNGEDLVVRREGGTVDGIGMKVFGAASLAKDEDVVVFLEHRGANRYVVGMAQGKLSLYRDARGLRRVRRDLSEVTYTRPTTAAERALSTTATAKQGALPIDTLDELATEVTRLRREAKRP